VEGDRLEALIVAAKCRHEHFEIWATHARCQYCGWCNRGRVECYLTHRVIYSERYRMESRP
jgi:hypothetical protein